MKLVTKESRIGLGAFLLLPVKTGEIIVDWSPHPFFQIPPRVPSNWHFRQTSPGILSGPIGPEEHPDAYINHSCEPAAEIRFDRPRIHLVALRDLKEGDEVTFDYATLYKSPWGMKCDCGTASCRGTIRGKLRTGDTPKAPQPPESLRPES